MGAVIAVGHAYGCWIARTLSHDRPELINGIILLAAGAGKWPESLSRDIEIAMDENNPEKKRLSALQRAFFAPGNKPDRWLTGWHPKLVKMQRAARARTEVESWWSGGEAPILDIVGLQDPFRPASELNFYVNEFAPRVELQTIDGASHALPDERPEETAQIMSDWIKTQQVGRVK